MCKRSINKRNKRKYRRCRVRMDAEPDELLEDWMCAGAPLPSQ